MPLRNSQEGYAGEIVPKKRPESLEQQSLYRHYQVNRDQSCLLSSFLPDQYLAEQYPLLVQQASHILPTGFTCEDL